MTYPLLSLRDKFDVEIETINFGTLAAASYSEEIELRVWNNYHYEEEAIDAHNVIAKILDENSEEAGEAIEGKWVEYKIGHYNDTATPEIIDDDWKPMGKGFYPALGSIQENTYRTLYLRLRAPVGVATESLSLHLSLGDGVSPEIISDLCLLSQNGIFTEELFKSTGILSIGTFTYYENDKFDTGRIVLRKEGKLIVVPKTQITLNQEDSSGNELF